MLRFKDARDCGGSYLLKVIPPDGGFGSLGVNEYCKVLAALEVCGHSSAANLLCDWIRKKDMTPEGDFGQRSKGSEDFNYTYPNSWVVIGSHRLGNFDLSRKGMDFLMTFWDAESGGFYSSSLRRDADTEQHILYVSFCGLAAIYTGRIEVARAVGGWMRTVIEAQPDFPRRLYTVYNRAKGLIIAPDNELRYVVSSGAASHQFFFQPGAAGAFLASLYGATGEREWLELAKDYMRFAETACDYLFRLFGAGKVGWASSLLFTITGEIKYKKMAIRIGDNLITAQSKKGFWKVPGNDTPSIGLTAEMTVWLNAIHQAVGVE